MIEGVSLHPLKHISVPNGDVFHALKCTEEGYSGFGEAYFTQIESGKVKGWRRHNRITLNLVVVYGKIKFVIYDDREGSKTKGQFEEVILSPKENYQRLTVEPGLWMAFCGVDKNTSMLMDIIPEPHDPSEADKKELDNIPFDFFYNKKMNTSMKNVLVTGANGFLGKNLVKALLSSGKNVIAVSHSLEEELKNNDNLIWINPKNKTIQELKSELIDKKIECIYHLAWSGTSGNNRGDYEIQIQNIKLACDYARLCDAISCRRFVYASSINEIETYEYLKSDNICPGNGYIYGSAKLAAHFMAEVISYQLGVDFIPCLITNIFGAGEKSARLINDSVRKLYKGEHCSFSSGNQTYDFIYITDAVNAIISVGEKGKAFNQYYIGSDNPRPLKDFLLEMKSVVAPESEIGLGDLPFYGKNIDYSQFDINKVEKDTGYHNKISFEKGINLVLSHIKSEKQ